MRFVRIALKSLLMLVLLLSLLLTLALQFLSTEAGRSFAARQLGKAASGAMQGRVDVTLHGLTPRSLDATASLYDRGGRRLARVEHVTIELDTWRLAVSWYHHKPLLVVRELRAQKVELGLDGDWAHLPKKKAGKGKPVARPDVVADRISIERLDFAATKDIALRGRVVGSLQALEHVRAKLDFKGDIADLPLKLSASLDRGKIQGKATLAGYGASARIDVHGQIADQRRFGFEAAIDVPDCQKVPLKQAPKSGSLRARTSGQLDLQASTLDGKLEVDAAKLGWRGVTVDQASLRGRWQGSLRALPTGRVQVAFAGVHAGPWQGAAALVGSGDVQLGRDGIRVEALASDRNGILFRASAQTKLSARAPLTASVSVPERLLSTLPVPVALSPDARVSATADVSGTMAAPEVRVRARLLAQGGVVDVTATGHPARFASVRSKLELVQDVRLNIQRFPLQSVIALDSVGVSGLVNGAAYADGQDGGRAVAHLEVKELTLEGKTIPAATASTMLVGGRLAAYVNMGGEQQFLRAELGAKLAGPKLIDSADLKLDARRFPVAVVLPLGTSGPLVVRGDLDGSARLTLAAGQELRQMAGSLRFSNGVFSLPTFGPALQGVSADIRLDPSGRIDLHNVTAGGVRGRVQGEGQVVLKGLAFDSARFSLRANKGDEFALWVGGAPIGAFRGRVDFLAQRQPDGGVDLRYDVPDAVLELPRPRAALRPLREDPTIVVGVVTEDGRTLTLQREQPRARGKSKFRLGGTLRRVRITRPGQIELVVRGDPVLQLGSPLTATGEVQVQQGWVSVLGKRFQVERGTVRFVGEELTKASVVASAVWVANDGTRVRVGVQGTLGELKTTLQSEPARSENEIVQLIMTGTTEDTLGLEHKDPLATAVGTGAAARVVNDALAGIAPGVQTRVDTTNPLNPQPEVEVQASEKVSVRYSTSLGQTAEGVDRSTTSVDYRAGERWLISAKHGNTGSTAVDVVWQFRY